MVMQNVYLTSVFVLTTLGLLSSTYSASGIARAERAQRYRHPTCTLGIAYSYIMLNNYKPPILHLSTDVALQHSQYLVKQG